MGAELRKDGTRPLLHDAANSKHDSLEKVKFLVSRGVDVSQTNGAGCTLLHVAAASKPPQLRLIEFLLSKDVYIDQTDRKGDTALHKVVKNYAERTIPWEASEKAMKVLLTKSSSNVANKQGFTPFRLLVRIMSSSCSDNAVSVSNTICGNFSDDIKNGCAFSVTLKMALC